MARPIGHPYPQLTPAWRTFVDKQIVNQSTFEADAYAVACAKLLGFVEGEKVKGENTFITFNYDTIVEEALSTLGLKVSYGFG